MSSSISEPIDEAVKITEASQDAITINDEASSLQIPSNVVDPPSTNSRLSNSEEEKIDIDVDGSSDSKIPSNSETSLPLFTVSFRDKRVAQQYRESVKEYLQTYVSSNSELRLNSNSELLLEVWKKNCKDEPRDVGVESKNSQNPDNLLFTIDKQPAPKDDFNIPTYGKKYNKVFEESSGEVADEQKKDRFLSKIECFNCLGNHSLRECDQPLNNVAICKNRKEFSSNKAMRYHLDNEQRFGHMVPGLLSKNLRKALGLKDNQLPRHIYRMRILGYPPGWLEEARLQHSGLSLFNCDGVAEQDPNEEPGQIFNPEDRDQYDVKKIYDFPGFNVPPPPGTHDEYKQYWAPQMQAIHSKETMLSMLRDRRVEDGYKRKKLKMSTMLSSPATDCQTITVDMDLEEDTGEPAEMMNGHFIPPPPKEPVVAPSEQPAIAQQASEDLDKQLQEAPSPNSENEQSTAPSSRTNSPSLSDLEHMKKRLLVALEDSSSQSNPSTPTRNDPAAKVDSKSELTPRTNREGLNSSQGSVKSVDLGTPVLQSTSPYSKLPSSDKFSKNICDVITYENLPDSTGKYTQLTGVLQKVRDTLAKIHQDS